MPYRVITFDLDDTLWDVRPALITAEHSTRAWLRQHAPDMFARFDSNALHAIRNELLANDPALAHQLSRMRRDTYYVALQRTGYRDDEAARIADAAFAVFLDGRHSVTPFDGVADMLAELSQHYVLGALSNGNANLQRIPIGVHFAFHFSAEQVGAAKPHRAMFDAAVDHSNVDRNDMLHVGDNFEHDVQGAWNAGISAVWVNANGQQQDAPAQAATTEKAAKGEQAARPAAEIASVLALRDVLKSLA